MNVLGLSHTFDFFIFFTNRTFILSGAVTQKKFKIEKKMRITFFSQKHVLSDETKLVTGPVFHIDFLNLNVNIFQLIKMMMF